MTCICNGTKIIYVKSKPEKCLWCKDGPKPLKVAEEVLLIVRELSKKHGYTFRWRDFRDAYGAVYGKFRNHQTPSSFNMTVGNMIRAQVKGGIIQRVPVGDGTKRSFYIFKDVTKISHPMYIVPGMLRKMHRTSKL